MGILDELLYDVDIIDGGSVDRVRVIISSNGGIELGSLYFEKAKKTFHRKPVSMNSWVCVDAKVEALYSEWEGITPKEVVNKCQSLIGELMIGKSK